MFDYNNLNYACPKCNINKGTKYDEKMINPSVEDPEKHIYFKGDLAKAYDERGQIMIDVLDLNNSERTREKVKLLKELQKDINEIIMKYKKVDNKSNDWLIDFRNQIIKVINKIRKHSRHGSKYCTMCKHNFVKSLKLLKEIVIKIDNRIQ